MTRVVNSLKNDRKKTIVFRFFSKNNCLVWNKNYRFRTQTTCFELSKNNCFVLEKKLSFLENEKRQIMKKNFKKRSVFLNDRFENNRFLKTISF